MGWSMESYSRDGMCAAVRCAARNAWALSKLSLPGGVAVYDRGLGDGACTARVRG